MFVEKQMTQRKGVPGLSTEDDSRGLPEIRKGDFRE